MKNMKRIIILFVVFVLCWTWYVSASKYNSQMDDVLKIVDQRVSTFDKQKKSLAYDRIIKIAEDIIKEVSSQRSVHWDKTDSYISAVKYFSSEINKRKIGLWPLEYQSESYYHCRWENNWKDKLCWGVDTGLKAEHRNFREILLSGTAVRLGAPVGVTPVEDIVFNLEYPTEIAFRIRFTREEWKNKFNNGLSFTVDRGVPKMFMISKSPFNVDYSEGRSCKSTHTGSNVTTLMVTIDPNIGGCVIDPDVDYWFTIKPFMYDNVEKIFDDSTYLRIGWF